MSVEMDFDGDEAYREILHQVRDEAELLAKGREEAEEVKDFAVSISPVGSVADGDDSPGSYAGAWHVEDRVRRVNGMPAFRVTNDNKKAELIENGTGQHNPRPQGGSSPEFAIRGKTAARFAGTEESADLDS